MNWNVYVTLLQRVGDSFAQGIWAFVALPTYIWLIENHSNKVRYEAHNVQLQAIAPQAKARSNKTTRAVPAQAVGYAQGIQGFAMAAVAVPGEPSQSKRYITEASSGCRPSTSSLVL